jgi:hypothetical protein
MKTIRITLSKDGAQAACTMEYQLDHQPLHTTWSGNRDAFKLAGGQLPDFGFPIDSLPRVIAHQAAQSGATFTLEDLGGEAASWEE